MQLLLPLPALPLLLLLLIRVLLLRRHSGRVACPPPLPVHQAVAV